MAPFEIEHIVPRKHHGRTVAGNLALSCIYCNAFNGPNLTGRDPTTRKITVLYHPRRHKWAITSATGRPLVGLLYRPDDDRSAPDEPTLLGGYPRGPDSGRCIRVSFNRLTASAIGVT